MPDGKTIEVPPPSVSNPLLKEMGSAFQLAAVDGEIRFEPWLDLMAQGKFPVGDPHDLQTHWAAILLTPPELGRAYQGQLGFLRAVQTELESPGPVLQLIEKRLGKLGGGFEIGTYSIGSTLAGSTEINFESLAWSYQLFLGDHLAYGAPAELKNIGTQVLKNWESLGFPSRKEAHVYHHRLEALLAQREKDDPSRYAALVPKSEITPLLRSNFVRLGIAPQ